MTGCESLQAAVMADIERKHHGCKTFHPEGCPCKGKCFHDYCDTFAWVIERAKHYADKTGGDWEKILDAWEKDRHYWYMNYYQEANQPLIPDKARIFDTLQQAKESVGKDFYCPSCGKVINDARKCPICDWKAYGLFRTMDNGATFYVKETKLIYEIFWPVSWGKKETVQ